MYNITPRELYENYLQFYKTDVFDIVMADQMIGATKTVMSVNYTAPLYTFDIYLQGGEASHFNLYENGQSNLFDVHQSAIYVLYAAMNLGDYRQRIDKQAMKLLAFFLRSKTRNQKQQQLAYMHPLLFYRNLVFYTQKRPDIKILKRDDAFLNDDSLQIRPIYDPSCHSISIYYQGQVVEHELEINEETYDRLQYQCLAIVDALVGIRDADEIRRVVTTTKFDKTYYMNRLKPLNKSRLFACKISRLRRPGQQDVEYATKLFDRVFDAYKRLYASDDLIENACEKTLENMYQDLLMIQMPINV